MHLDLPQTIDHTALKPDLRERDIIRLCEEAVEFGFYGVCVNGCRVATAADALKGTKQGIAAVTGFPLGACAPRSKARETAAAIEDGATEIDTVLNIGLFLDGNLPAVLGDLRGVVSAAAGHPVKIIIETGFLDDAQKRSACALAVDAGAAFVKTSTGFGPGGATEHDIRLMKETVGDHCQVKASGGIRDRKAAMAMLSAGATRLGTSSGVAIVGGTSQSGKPGGY